jgi:hypothetical protein
MKTRQQLEINKCIGITVNDELIMVDYLFNDTMHDKPFHGATGTMFSGITQDYIDERNNLDSLTEDYEYLWKEAVQAGSTELGLKDYMIEQKEINDCNSDGLFIGHDTSSIHLIPDEIKEKYFSECESFECIGGGRMFPIKADFKVIFRQDLLDLVNKIESEPIGLDKVVLTPSNKQESES